MTQCNYIYASGLRVKDGDGCVIVDGKRLRVVRDGNGKSRLDLAGPKSDGEISLKDLRRILEERGESSITLAVSGKTGRGGVLEFKVDLDPAAAMGRQGREGDFVRALAAIRYVGDRAALAYQLMTLPDSDKQAGIETVKRLRLAVTTLGVRSANKYLDGRFGLLADQDLLDETLAYITSEKYSYHQRRLAKRYASYQASLSAPWYGTDDWMERPLLQEPGQALVRVTGSAISDPSRVPDEYFKVAADWVLSHETSGATKLKFVDDTFDRLDDDSLKEIIYRGLKDDSTRAEYTVMITDPGRLQRIKDWDPDVSIVGELRNMVTRDPEYLQARFLGDVARDLSTQFRYPEGQELDRSSTEAPSTEAPLDIVRSLFKRSK